MERSRRLAIPLVLAILVVSALFASSASATTPQWIVEGSALSSPEPLAEATNVTETFSFKTNVAGVSVKIGCTGMSLPESQIEGERTRKDDPFVMSGCTLTGAPSCSIPSTISLENLTSTLEGTVGAFKLKFVPVGGPTAAAMTVMVSGASCAFTGPFVIKGTMSCNYPGVETEAVNHVLEFSLTSGSELKHGTEKVTLTGKDEFWLKTNKKWKVA